MSKFRIGQKVKLVNFYPYNNITGIIDSVYSLKNNGHDFYSVRLLDKELEDAGWNLNLFLICERNLVLVNRNLTNE